MTNPATDLARGRSYRAAPEHERELADAAIRAMKRHGKPWPVVRNCRVAIAFQVDSIPDPRRLEKRTTLSVYVSEPMRNNREAHAAAELYLLGFNIGDTPQARLHAATINAGATFTAAARRCGRRNWG